MTKLFTLSLAKGQYVYPVTKGSLPKVTEGFQLRESCFIENTAIFSGNGLVDVADNYQYKIGDCWYSIPVSEVPNKNVFPQ